MKLRNLEIRNYESYNLFSYFLIFSFSHHHIITLPHTLSVVRRPLSISYQSLSALLRALTGCFFFLSSVFFSSCWSASNICCAFCFDI